MPGEWTLERDTVQLLSKSCVNKNLTDIDVFRLLCVIQLDTDDVVTVPVT